VLRLFDNVAKRLLDLCLTILVLPFFIILWLGIAICIKLDSSGPVFYIHKRVGRGAKEFNCYKFRSMKLDSDPNRLAESSDDSRITRLGKFLRASSLDETPQIINVLLGDMSIVGPRPALKVQVEHFGKQERWKLEVKPGLTGWTQINGRNSIPYEKRMELDCWYAQNRNFFLDIWIIIKTFFVLFKKQEIYDPKSSSPSK
jgi:undecaprenyl phosphate N,N'-diacetylbacillosamine 1-phosphate transferase